LFYFFANLRIHTWISEGEKNPYWLEPSACRLSVIHKEHIQQKIPLVRSHVKDIPSDLQRSVLRREAKADCQSRPVPSTTQR